MLDGQESSHIRDGLKTDNGYRVATISGRLARLLEKKRKHAEAALASADPTSGITDISRMPIVHDKNNLFRHCASTQLSTEFRKLYAQDGYSEKYFLQL